MIFAADKAGERLDVFLTRMQPEFSRSHVQKLIASGNATVNQAVRKGNYKLKAGDAVELSVPEPENTEILPEDIPLDIIYEDASYYFNGTKSLEETVRIIENRVGIKLAE